MTITVNCADKAICFGGKTYPCRIGRGGYIAQEQGREGDEKTPLGKYHIRYGLYRADQLPRPRSKISFRPLRPHDGWCDDPKDPAYNRHIRLPYAASHEKLWREDGAYDIILVMSHNDSPPDAGKGSAVFIHVAQPDDRETMGCVALAPEVMVQLLNELEIQTCLNIQ